VPEYVFVDPLPDGEGDVTIGEITDWDVEPGEPEPLPDDVDLDDPCAIDPLGCAYDGWGGGLYDGGPYDGGVYGGGFDDYGQYDDGSYFDGPYADYDLSEYACSCRSRQRLPCPRRARDVARKDAARSTPPANARARTQRAASAGRRGRSPTLPAGAPEGLAARQGDQRPQTTAGAAVVGGSAPSTPATGDARGP
jgi:hypothetical protein